MATLNKNMYMELIYNTVGAYTSSLKNEIAKELIAKEKVTLYDSHANNGFKYPILVENRLEAIDITSKDEDFLWFYENWEFKKSYKYSVPLTFEFSDNDTFENIISLLTSNEKIILFDEQNDFNAPSEISCDINDCIPYFKKDGDYILFKFIMKEVIYDDSFTPIDVKYSIIISINLHRNFLEIRFDGGRFEYKSQNEYITPKIKYCIKWLKDVLGFTLYNVDAKNAIEVIKNDSSKIAVVHKQMMELKSGGAAELTASVDRNYTLPFIGDFRQLISDNSELFNSAPKIKNLIEEFLNNQEETAYYPYIYVRWLDDTKAKQINVKIVFDYYDMKYIQMHNMQSSSRLTKERMEYAIEYLFESGSFSKGERI